MSIEKVLNSNKTRAIIRVSAYLIDDYDILRYLESRIKHPTLPSGCGSCQNDICPYAGGI
jgi:hypothetical protein